MPSHTNAQMDDLHFLADAALADAVTTTKDNVPTHPTPSTASGPASTPAPTPFEQRITLPPLSSIMPSPPPSADFGAMCGLEPKSSRQPQPRVTGWSHRKSEGSSLQRHKTGPSRPSSTRSKRGYPFGAGERHTSDHPLPGHEPRLHPFQGMPFPQQSSVPSDMSKSTTITEPHPLHRLHLDKTYPDRSVMTWHQEAQRLLDPPGSFSLVPSRSQSFSYTPSVHQDQQHPTLYSHDQVVTSAHHHQTVSPFVHRGEQHFPSSNDWALSQGPPPFIPHVPLPQFPPAGSDRTVLPSPASPRLSTHTREYTVISQSADGMRSNSRVGNSISDDSIASHRGRAMNRDLVVDGRRTASAHALPVWNHATEVARQTPQQDLRPSFLLPPFRTGLSTGHSLNSLPLAVMSPPTLIERNDSDVIMAEGDDEGQGPGSAAFRSSASYSCSPSPSSAGDSDPEPSRDRGTTIRLRIPPCPPSSITSGQSGPQSSTTRTHSASISSTASSLCVKNEPDCDWLPSSSQQGTERSERKRSRQGGGKNVSSSSRQLRDRARAARTARAEASSVDFDEEDEELRGTGGGHVRKNGPRRRLQNAVAQKRFRLKKKQAHAQMAADLESAQARADALTRQLAEKDTLLDRLQGQVGSLKRKLSTKVLGAVDRQ